MTKRIYTPLIYFPPRALLNPNYLQNTLDMLVSHQLQSLTWLDWALGQWLTHAHTSTHDRRVGLILQPPPGATSAHLVAFAQQLAPYGFTAAIALDDPNSPLYPSLGLLQGLGLCPIIHTLDPRSTPLTAMPAHTLEAYLDAHLHSTRQHLGHAPRVTMSRPHTTGLAHDKLVLRALSVRGIDTLLVPPPTLTRDERVQPALIIDDPEDLTLTRDWVLGDRAQQLKQRARGLLKRTPFGM